MARQIHGIRERITQCLAYVSIPLGAALPTQYATRSASSFTIDTGHDAWAEALSGIGPLIMLIGEKNTKQLLREANGLLEILSMACAPLGLLSVLTSMIRVSGSQNLRSYLGYEHEPRVCAAVEMTKVNCGGVHAEVVDGIVSRSTASDAMSKVLAVAYLRGNSINSVNEALMQIQYCYKFQSDKAEKGCPLDCGNVNWCLRVTFPIAEQMSLGVVNRIIAEALNIGETADFPNMFRDREEAQICKERTVSHDGSSRTVSVQPVLSKTENQQRSHQVSGPAELRGPNPGTSAIKTDQIKDEKRELQVTGTELSGLVTSSFFCTFDGVSEISTSPPKAAIWSLIITVTSFLAMIASQIIALWRGEWFSVGAIMVFVGYGCMVAGVSSAGYLIHTSCDSATMSARPRTNSAEWTHGLVALVKNTDSLDTTGSQLLHAQGHENVFQAVWLKKLNVWRFVLTWLISVFVTLSFICYYLGLRASVWWLSVTQLLVCLVAAFGRSVGKIEQVSFAIMEGVRVDKRCYSTGILDMQRASRISPQQRTSDTLDLRIYSIQSSQCLPLNSELIAWRAAKLCLEPKYRVTGDKILSIIGTKLHAVPIPGLPQRNVVVIFKGGIITEEGLAFPNATICLAFPSSTADLAAPTPLLARGIMRQSKWSVEQKQINKNSLPFLGGMYISSFDSMLTWWTIAEDRNEMGDQHKNLHGSFVLVSIAFFIALLREYGNDKELITGIEEAHRNSSDEDVTYAENLLDFLGTYIIQ